MHSQVVRLIGILERPEELCIDLARPDRDKTQPCKAKKAECRQDKHGEDGIEDVHVYGLRGDRSRKNKRLCSSEPTKGQVVPVTPDR
jgi:hypothetical protein